MLFDITFTYFFKSYSLYIYLFLTFLCFYFFPQLFLLVGGSLLYNISKVRFLKLKYTNQVLKKVI